MDAIELWVMVCALYVWACAPTECEASCESYRSWCGEERSYDCSPMCEAVETPKEDEACAECWRCLEGASCPELVPTYDGTTPACWVECQTECVERLK